MAEMKEKGHVLKSFKRSTKGENLAKQNFHKSEVFYVGNI